MRGHALLRKLPQTPILHFASYHVSASKLSRCRTTSMSYYTAVAEGSPVVERRKPAPGTCSVDDGSENSRKNDYGASSRRWGCHDPTEILFEVTSPQHKSSESSINAPEFSRSLVSKETTADDVDITAYAIAAAKAVTARKKDGKDPVTDTRKFNGLPKSSKEAVVDEIDVPFCPVRYAKAVTVKRKGPDHGREQLSEQYSRISSKQQETISQVHVIPATCSKLDARESAHHETPSTRCSIIEEAGDARIPDVANKETVEVNAEMISPAQDSFRSCTVTRVEESVSQPQQDVITVSSSQDASKVNTTEESKKNLYQVAFPVTVFVEWWIICFMKSTEHVAEITFPLGKIHLWVAAYQRVHLEMTGRHADGNTIGSLIRQLHVLQAVVIRGSFRWSDTRHIYLPSPVEGAPMNPAFQDNVVQEVLLLILEPIFEARFSARSHAFRPGRDAHTALKAVTKSFLGCSWFISGSVDTLDREVYVPRIVECVVRVVRDPRVSSLLKSGLLSGVRPTKLGQEGKEKSHMISDWGSCCRLKNFLCNVYLDKFDWWMDDHIQKLSGKAKHLPGRAVTNTVSSATVKPCCLKYVRHGTEFLVGCNGSHEEAENVRSKLCSFFKQTYRMDFSNQWSINHISYGITFLDHVISKKVVHLTISRCRPSYNKVIKKRPSLLIKLSLNASRGCCAKYLKEVSSPTDSQQIRDMLSTLNNWYRLADNRQKTIEFCKYHLCAAYAKMLFDKKEDNFSKIFKDTVQVLEDVKASTSTMNGPQRTIAANLWIPEHEIILKTLALLRNQQIMETTRDGFRISEKRTPQQCMGQVVWQFLQGMYPVKDDYVSDSVQNVLYDIDLGNEDIAENIA